MRDQDEGGNSHGSEYHQRGSIYIIKKYNQDPFHIQHALTVEGCMKWYANELGYAYVTLDLEGFRSGSMDIHLKKG